MRSVNYALRKAYIAKLDTDPIMYDSVKVEVFYKQAPDDYTDKNYIILDDVSNNDTSTLHTSDTSTSISVGIFTFADKYNNGKAADDIADIVLRRIYPDKKTVLDLSADNFQMISTRMGGDNINSWTLQGQKIYADRTLIFRHNIYHLDSES